jgi:hypothetical protein
MILRGVFIKIRDNKNKVVYNEPVQQKYRYDLHIYIKNPNNHWMWYYWGSHNSPYVWNYLKYTIKQKNKGNNTRVIDTKTNKIL